MFASYLDEVFVPELSMLLKYNREKKIRKTLRTTQCTHPFNSSARVGLKVFMRVKDECGVVCPGLKWLLLL